MSNNKSSGFILVTVMIFLVLFTALVSQAFYTLQTEQRLYLALEKRNRLFQAAMKGLQQGKSGNVICNETLCVKSILDSNSNIMTITSMAKEGGSEIRIKAKFVSGSEVFWEQY